MDKDKISFKDTYSTILYRVFYESGPVTETYNHNYRLTGYHI